MSILKTSQPTCSVEIHPSPHGTVMWRALVVGGERLKRRPNFTYNSLYDIPNTNGSNPGNVFTAVKMKQTLGANAWAMECMCETRAIRGEATGSTLRGWTAMSLPLFLNFQVRSVLSAPLLHWCRLGWRTYNNSKKDRTIKVHLSKSPNRIALCIFLCWFSTMIMGITKAISPDTLMVDPAANQAFLLLTLLSLNLEWHSCATILSAYRHRSSRV